MEKLNIRRCKVKFSRQVEAFYQSQTRLCLLAEPGLPLSIIFYLTIGPTGMQ